MKRIVAVVGILLGFAGQSSAWEYHSHSALYAPSREVAAKEIKFPVMLVLRNGDTGEYKEMVLHSVEDLPLHSLETKCPEGEHQITVCYWVRYGEDK